MSVATQSNHGSCPKHWPHKQLNKEKKRKCNSRQLFGQLFSFQKYLCTRAGPRCHCFCTRHGKTGESLEMRLPATTCTCTSLNSSRIWLLILVSLPSPSVMVTVALAGFRKTAGSLVVRRSLKNSAPSTSRSSWTTTGWQMDCSEASKGSKVRNSFTEL